ncbi:hypothetical protein DSAG12_03514 [Promethearchaeum syntrophicum]|uniref:Uncharacterized protein n=1 Tax=Promethearchaeum syntrophicum TaxID=2594042 RepID=A0A5B9DG75_9ARCH|nr:hypothetical protein [Candidatus Prometheoarchaeum syntrophicum]QEE17677.1 hypothetical protein DSAG12_03514 [Candidatus Prometheoarchaeum syntrophicum]
MDFISNIQQKLISIREILLGRTKKQRRIDKPSYIGKKMIGLFIFFTLYSFIFVYLLNFSESESVFINILYFMCFKDPFSFGIALTFTFVDLALLFSNEKVLAWFFGKKTAIKQILICIFLQIMNFAIIFYLDDIFGYEYPLLLMGSTVWLLFQSIRLYSGSKQFAVKLEMRWTEQYSPFRTFLARFTPYFILGVLTFISIIFRYFVVLWTLDFIGVHAPNISLELYRNEMQTVMPMIYVGLLFIFIFILVQSALTLKKGDTRKSGAFDSSTFAWITFVMFLYALYNVALYLFLDPNFLAGTSIVLGSGSSSGGAFFFVEFLIAILFFVWIVADLSKTFQTGIAFISKDGLVMFLISTIFAQTTARYGMIFSDGDLARGGWFAGFITYDHLVLPILIILFLGITIIAYWRKPQEMSMFLHINQQSIKSDEEKMSTILKFLKREFIRRGDKYQLSGEVYTSLEKITNIHQDSILKLIQQLDKKYMDLQLTKEKVENGSKQSFIHFLPITDQYSREDELKAKKYMQDRFSTLIRKKQRKRMNFGNGSYTSSKNQASYFIQSLSVQYGKKIKDEASFLKSQEEKEQILHKAITQDEHDLVLNLVRTEYLKRITEIIDYPKEFRINISEFAGEIQKATKIPVKRIPSIISDLVKEDWNLKLISKEKQKDGKENRWIEFFPISDFEIYEQLYKYRPETLSKLNQYMWKVFYKGLTFKRYKLQKLPPEEYKDEQFEFKRSFRSKWFAKTMLYFAKYYTKQQNFRDSLLKSNGLQDSINLITTGNKETTKEK